MKKLISLLITFTMVVALFASLNVTAVSAASETLYNFQYYNSSNKYLYTGYKRILFPINPLGYPEPSICSWCCQIP